MAQDINEQPLKSGESVTVWVKPREGLKAGEYKDLITYQTEEGADVFFEADFSVEAGEKDDKADSGKQPNQKKMKIKPINLP